MELTFIFLWAVVAFLGYELWVLRKTYGSSTTFLSNFRTGFDLDWEWSALES
ncbi:MAG: hypothetical protein OEM58_06315 [Nitrospirota bacterium]|nr:hypothetical protein [Nitrospirota bacterium]